MLGDVGAQHLEQLLRHPVGDGVVVGDVDGAGQVGEQSRRVDDLQGVLPVHTKGDHQARHRILDVVDAAPELEVRILAAAHEVDLDAVEVAPGQVVGEDAEEGNLGGVEAMAPGRQRALDLALVHEDGDLVRGNDRIAEAANVEVRPFEDDLSLAVLGDGDVLALGREEAGHQRPRGCGRYPYDYLLWMP